MAAAPRASGPLVETPLPYGVPPDAGILQVLAGYGQFASTVAELERRTCKVAELQQSLGQLESQAAVRVRELDEFRAAADRLHTTNRTLQQRADQAEAENTSLKAENAEIKIRLAYFTTQQNGGHGLAAGYFTVLGVLDDAAAADDGRPDPAARQMSMPGMRTPAARAIEDCPGPAVPASTRASATPSSTPGSGSRNSTGFSLKKKPKNSNDRKRIKAVKSASCESDTSGPVSPRRPASGSSPKKAVMSSPRRTFSANRFKSPVGTKKARTTVSPMTAKAGGGGGGRGGRSSATIATDKGPPRQPRPTRSRSRAEAEAAAAQEPASAIHDSSQLASRPAAGEGKADAADAISTTITPSSSDSEEQDSEPGRLGLGSATAACDVSLMEMNSEAFSQVIDRPPSPDLSAKKKHRNRSSFSPMVGRSPASPDASAKKKSRRRPCPSPMAGQPSRGNPITGRAPVPFAKVSPSRTPLHQLVANQDASRRWRTQGGSGGAGAGLASPSERRDVGSNAMSLHSMQGVEESAESPAHYVEVVRKKDDREFLQGTDCAECMEYFTALHEKDPVAARKHMNEVSRHRHGKGCGHSLRTVEERKEVERTYWDIAFPQTQDDPAQAHLKNRSREPRTRRESSEYTESMMSDANLDANPEPITTSGWLGGGKKKTPATAAN